jgi:hypothetical protein
MPSSPTASVDSNSSADPEIEFINPKQVEALYDLIENRYNEVQTELEAYEMMDDDIQELREVSLNKYELNLLAEAYEAAGHHSSAAEMREQAEEYDERIKELQTALEENNLENLDDVKNHMMSMVELEIQRETYEIQLKACKKYLEKLKRKAYLETKKTTLKPASPRRYPKAASPSRLNTEVGREYTSLTPKASPRAKPERLEKVEKTEKPAADKKALPLISLPAVKKS